LREFYAWKPSGGVSSRKFVNGVEPKMCDKDRLIAGLIKNKLNINQILTMNILICSCGINHDDDNLPYHPEYKICDGCGAEMCRL